MRLRRLWRRLRGWPVIREDADAVVWANKSQTRFIVQIKRVQGNAHVRRSVLGFIEEMITRHRRRKLDALQIDGPLVETGKLSDDRRLCNGWDEERG